MERKAEFLLFLDSKAFHKVSAVLGLQAVGEKNKKEKEKKKKQASLNLFFHGLSENTHAKGDQN